MKKNLENYLKYGTKVNTADGVGKVVQIDILAEKVKVKVGDDEEFKFQTYDAKDVTVIKVDKK